MVDLTTSFAGLQLKNPIIIGSSGLTDSLNSIKTLEENGAAAVVLKSLFEEEIIREMQSGLAKMSNDDFLYPETLEFYEFDDTHEESTMMYLELIRNLKAEVKIPVIASINCVTAQQWTYFPKQIELAGADAIELNIFVFPSNLNRTSTENEKVYFDIVNAVTSQVSIPVIAKISYYFSTLGNMILQLSRTPLKGIVLFNRYYNPDFDLDNFEVTSANVLSSPSDLYQSLRWVGLMSGRVDCDLAATTGVHDSKALIKQILAGASAIQLASCIYKNGPEYIGKILKDTENWMSEKNFATLGAFKGRMSQENTKDPAAFQRIQFMKYFRGYSY